MKARIFILSGLCMLSLLVLKANVNNPKSISSFHNTSDIPLGYEELELQYVYTLNPAKKPGPSSNSNIIRIPISNRPVGSQYSLKWYNSETGLQYNYSLANVTVQQDANGKYLSFTLPSSIRDFYNNIINNTFGDVVFAIYYVVQGGTMKNNKENKE